MDCFNNKCLLCLLNNKNIKNVLSEDEDGIVIGAKFTYVLREENITLFYNKIVNYKQQKPKHICIDCLGDLNHVYNFKQKCLKNLKSLSDYIDCIEEILAEKMHHKEGTINELQDNYGEENNMVIKLEPEDIQDNTHKLEEKINKNNLEEIVIKGEPANINNEIHLRNDPLLSEGSYTEYLLQNEAADNEDYLSTAIIKEVSSNKCSKCHATFTQPTSLFLHKPIYSDTQTQCTVCDRTVNQSKTFSPPKRSITRDRPFPCDLCDKTFLQKAHLIEHNRTHTGEKPFVCEICDKAFTQRSQLIKHIRTHTGEKPYKCDICDRPFSQAGHLMEHKRIHTGEKPFECDECDKAFSQKSNLIKHKRTHIGSKL